MVQVNVKSTGINPSASHPHKAHKKLRFGYARVGKHKVGSEWLREKRDGYMTKLRGKPPYRFLHRKNITFPSHGKHGKSGKGAKPVGNGNSVMSRAAKKAWATRRKHHH